MARRLKRRRFLGQVGAGTVGAVAASHLGTARACAANEAVRVGCIGTGGRCRQLMRAAKEIAGVRLVAVCDINDRHLEMGKQLAEDGAFATRNYHEMLGRDDIDAVIIGSPDHWHVPMAADACTAGKDVYVEKPLTHNLAEGEEIIDAQNQNKRIVQVGTQQRSMPQFHKAREIIRSGAIGKVVKVHLTWNRNAPVGRKHRYSIDPKTVDWKRFLGNAPKQPYDEYRLRNWRWFWDFGGGIFTDLMVHYIDATHWLLDLDHPTTATSIGDTFQGDGLWETPETVQTLLRYPDKQVQVYFEGTFSNARSRAMLEFMGTKATLYLDRGRYEIHPEHQTVKYSEWVLDPKKPRGSDFFDNPNGEVLHVSNWIDCVRSRKRPNCPAEAGVSAAAAAHLANKALRSGNVAHWSA